MVIVVVVLEEHSVDGEKVREWSDLVQGLMRCGSDICSFLVTKDLAIYMPVFCGN